MTTFDGTAASGSTAVSLTEIKKQLEILASETAHDTQLAMLVAAAQNQFELHTRYLIGARSKTIILDHFTSNPLYLPFRPINSITSIEVNGTAYTAFTEDLTHEPPRIYPTSHTWPTTTEPIANIVIGANIGMATDNLPTDIKQAIMFLAAHWFENREAVVTGTIATELPLGVKMIFDSYKICDGYLTSLSRYGSG